MVDNEAQAPDMRGLTAELPLLAEMLKRASTCSRR
jgi:hypothetical protein